VTLYARWKINKYTITYIGNGNEAGTAPTAISADYGTDITIADNSGDLTKRGYRFVGWNTAADGMGTTYQPDATLTLTNSNMTLYAQWEINTYTITYIGNESEAGTAPIAITEDYGTTVTIADNSGGLSKRGYSFA